MKRREERVKWKVRRKVEETMKKGKEKEKGGCGDGEGTKKEGGETV